MMKILFICFGALLGIANAGFLNGGRSGDLGQGHIETIRVIQENGGHGSPQYTSHDNSFPENEGRHINTIRVIQENGDPAFQSRFSPGFGGHINTVRVIQENGGSVHNSGGRTFGGRLGNGQGHGDNGNGGHASSPAYHNDAGPAFGGNINTIRVIQENGGSVHNDVGPVIGGQGHYDNGNGGHVNTVHVIQESEPIESHDVGVDQSEGNGHIETIRVIEDNGGQIHNGAHAFSDNSANGGGQVFNNAIGGGIPDVQTIRVIQESGDSPTFGGHIQSNSPAFGGHIQRSSPAFGGRLGTVHPFNSGEIQTIRVIQDDIVNHLRSGAIGGGHPVGNGHVQIIRIINGHNGRNLDGGNHIVNHIGNHNGGRNYRGYNYEHLGPSPVAHSKIIRIVAASARNRNRNRRH